MRYYYIGRGSHKESFDIFLIITVRKEKNIIYRLRGISVCQIVRFTRAGGSIFEHNSKMYLVLGLVFMQGKGLTEDRLSSHIYISFVITSLLCDQVA